MSTDPDKTGLWLALGMGLALVAYHLFLSTRSDYGYFIDELYYIACSKRPALGYVDHPPLSVLLLAVNRRLLGDSLPALRLLPSLAMGATVFVTGMMTRRLGGASVAVGLACLAVVAMPVGLIMGSFYSMNAFEILLVAILALLLMRLLDGEDPRAWIGIGIVMGVGLEVKHTMVLYGLVLIVGMLLTPARRLLWNRWFAWGVFACAALALPNLYWQLTNGFPSLEFYRNAMVNKNIPRGALGIVADQSIFVNPFTLPLWVAGLVSLFAVGRGKKYRAFGWAYAALILVMILSRSSRPDRIAAIYPMLFAAGAVTIQMFSRPILRRAIAGVAVTLSVGGFLIAAPICTPLLSPQKTSQLIDQLGISLSIESGKTRDPLPQWLGDRLGWRELAVEVSRVYHALPPEERRNSVIVSTNYGEAGALELYGRDLGLPPVFATHNSYHLWGPPPDSIRTYIGVAVSRRDLERLFDRVEEAGVTTCEYCTRPQQRIPIYIARGPRFSVFAEWPKFKIFS